MNSINTSDERAREKTHENTMDLDEVSLQQALRDFETANARVLDLTQRLVRSEQQRRQLGDELERLRLQLHQAGPPPAAPEPAGQQGLTALGLTVLGRLAKKAYHAAKGA